MSIRIPFVFLINLLTGNLTKWSHTILKSSTIDVSHSSTYGSVIYAT